MELTSVVSFWVRFVGRVGWGRDSALPGGDWAK